jgi:hypothetical protein
MERGGAMFLDNEGEGVLLLGLRRFAGRLRRNVEVPLLGVFLECHIAILTRTRPTAFTRTLQHEWPAVHTLSDVCCLAGRGFVPQRLNSLRKEGAGFMPAPPGCELRVLEFLRRSPGFRGVLLHGVEQLVEVI